MLEISMPVQSPLRRVLSVSELNRLARELLEKHLPLAWVAGEISNFKRYDSGHCYFTLKDETAQVDCVMFRQKAMLLDWQPDERHAGRSARVRDALRSARQVPAERRSRCAARGSARSTKRSSG